MNKLFRLCIEPKALMVIFLFFIFFAAFPISTIYGETNDSASQLPGKSRIISGADSALIPFDIYRGDIRYDCEINGHKIKMLLDDGYMWDELLFWGNPKVDSLGFNYDGTVIIRDDSTDPGALVTRTASGITVRFPDVEFTEQKAYITPSGSGIGSMWAGSEGQFSASFFKHYVIAINFDNMTISFIKPDKFKYNGNGSELLWEPMGFGPWSIPATITLEDGRVIDLKLLVDLGYNDQLKLNAKNANRITAPKKVLAADLGMNIQKVISVGYIGRLPKIKLGKYEIKDLLTSFVPNPDTSHPQEEAMIGLNLLSRFNLIYDYSRRRLIIEPNKRFKKPFEYDMSGIVMRKSNDGFREIKQIYDNSPAADAGLQVGDKIASINGRPAAEYDIFELDALFVQEGKTIRLVIRRGDTESEVSLKLRRII
jgi:hypothetical protein